MNRNEFENWMKDKMQDQPFQPDEGMWQKLQADLQKPTANKKQTLVFLPWMKIAASVLVMLSLGVATSYFIKGSNHETDKTVAGGEKSYINIKQKTEPDTTAPAIASIITKSATASTVSTINKENKTEQKAPLPVAVKEEKITPQVAQTSASQQKKEPVPRSSFHKDFINDNANKRPAYREPDPTLYASNEPKKQAIDLGMSAGIGKSSVSNIAGYQVGVVGRGNISKRVFVEAGIVLASNTVSNSSQHTFNGVEMGLDGLTNTTNKTTSQVQANYARNIISVGFNPSIGVKVTRRLSISTGGAVYRNLNPSLELTNASDIESAALTNDIISTSQTVNSWDLGLTCNADYKVTKNLSFNVNYRKGLTDYLQQNNKYIKNSGVLLGLKFMLGR